MHSASQEPPGQRRAGGNCRARLIQYAQRKGGNHLEIKINKEIRQYQENIFFGLSMRQFICSLCAVGLAVGIYFLLKNPLGEETVSWLCIVAAAPVAVLGFFKYNGLTAEQFLCAFIKSELLCAGQRVFRAENFYYQAIEKGKKGGKKRIDKDTEKRAEKRKG